MLSILPTSGDPIGTTFSKLLLASSSDLEALCVQDKVLLEAQLVEARSSGDESSLPFVEQALVFVEVFWLLLTPTRLPFVLIELYCIYLFSCLCS